MARWRVVAALAITIVARAHGFSCGVDDPAFHSVLTVPEVALPQQYHNEDVSRRLREAQRERRLQAQDYGAFVPLSALHAAGLAPKMRIGLVWDVVDSGDFNGGDARQCSYLGQTIKVLNAAGGEVEQTNFCTAQHLVTGAAGAARGTLMRDRTQAARVYWQDALRVRPVVDSNITIASSVVSSFNLTTTTVPNVDLVIIMTARPSPLRPVAGYAGCRQRDQHGRCTVGWFNWVPELLNVDKRNNPDVISSEMHTALHEIVHVLGGMNPGYSAGSTTFVDGATGVQIDPRGTVYIQDYDAVYEKTVTKIVTPKVLNVSRTHFNCPTMNGFPLEDLPLGAGSHWEARLAGPELMSYGSGSGQVFVGDLTFAFLEDTNQYIANYSMGGKLTPDEADDFALSGLTFLQAKDAPSTYTPPPAWSPGAMTWGRGEGCSFVTGTSRNWPAKYTCSKNQEYGCTPDNRMSAVCVIKKDYNREPACAGQYLPQNATSATLACGLTNSPCSGSLCNIPSSMRFFTTDAAARSAANVAETATTVTALTTGGFSSAMDYVPVQVGYWACNTDNPAANVSAGVDGVDAGFSNFELLFGSKSDISKFGGQARCPQCRCLKSSLLEISRGIIPTFDIYGLCYRTNCYREDYLQVAVKGQFGRNTAYWYKCPPEGGKLYITGFVGSIHCPPAAQFCRMETVTGLKYPEGSFLAEAIFWGTLVGLVVLFGLICMIPCARDRLITFFKRICGALQFPTEYVDVPEPGSRPDPKTGRRKRVMQVARSRLDPKTGKHVRVHRKRRDSVTGEEVPPQTKLAGSCASWTLFLVNTLCMFIGLTMVALVAYAIYTARLLSVAIPLLGIALLVCIVAFVGMLSSRKRAQEGPSCWLLTYFYFNLILVLLLVWVIAYNLAFNNWNVFVEQYWDELSVALPAQYRQGATRAEQMASASRAVQDNIIVLASLAIVVLVIYLASLLAAAKLIHFQTLASMTVTICNHALMAAGLILLVVGFYLLASTARSAIMTLIAIILAAGAGAAALGIIGTIGVFRKSPRVLVLYATCVVILTAFMAYAVYAFISQGSNIASFLDGFSDSELATLASGLGLSMSKAEIIQNLQNNLRQLGLTVALCIGLGVAMFISAIVYYRAIMEEKQDAQEEPVPDLKEDETPSVRPRGTSPAPVSTPDAAAVAVKPQAATAVASRAPLATNPPPSAPVLSSAPPVVPVTSPGAAEAARFDGQNPMGAPRPMLPAYGVAGMAGAPMLMSPGSGPVMMPMTRPMQPMGIPGAMYGRPMMVPAHGPRPSMFGGGAPPAQPY